MVAWSWDFGDGNGSSTRHPVHSYALGGDYTVALTVTDNHGATDYTSQLVTAEDPPYSDHVATGESPVGGTVSGNYTQTWTDDGITESVWERQSGGRKSTRYSWLEHRWTFTIPDGDLATVLVNAWQSVSADGDQFEFAYSTDAANWTPMFTVSGASDSAAVESYALPGGTSGTVHVRVTDTDQGAGNLSLDSVFVDHMYIRVENAGGDPPDGDPEALVATPVSHQQIDLAWADNSSNETGFRVERRTGGGTWTTAGTTGPGATSFNDDGLAGSTAYDYRVWAFNLMGDSANPSNVASATTDPPPPPPDIELSADGRKVKGQHMIDLVWIGNTGAVDIFNGVDLIEAGVSGDRYTHATGNKGAASYVYQVCETGTSTCSNTATVDY